jgi:hypothetical protein
MAKRTLYRAGMLRVKKGFGPAYIFQTTSARRLPQGDERFFIGAVIPDLYCVPVEPEYGAIAVVVSPGQ